MKLGRRKQWLCVIQLVLIFHDILRMSETTLMCHDVLKSSCKKEVYCPIKLPIKQSSNPSKNKWNYLIFIIRIIIIIIIIDDFTRLKSVQ
jgi:hypothetical protein